jgi:hypothetical protein
MSKECKRFEIDKNGSLFVGICIASVCVMAFVMKCVFWAGWL